MSFVLHERLAADCHLVAPLTVCDWLLMDDARYAWSILVPRRAGLSDLHDLAPSDRNVVMDEVDQVARTLSALYTADKMNVAALGNLVPQLHIHVIARHTTDSAWPGPVWGVGTAEPYAPDALNGTLSRLRATLDAG